MEQNVSWGWGLEAGFTAIGHKEYFRSCRNILKMDCGYGCQLCKFADNHWIVYLKMGEVSCTSVVLSKQNTVVWIRPVYGLNQRLKAETEQRCSDPVPCGGSDSLGVGVGLGNSFMKVFLGDLMCTVRQYHGREILTVCSQAEAWVMSSFRHGAVAV